MKRQTITGICAIGLILLLGGCTRPPSLGPGEADFGNAVRHNIEAQVVNPEPMPEDGSAPYDGHRAARGINRYQTDDIKQPRSLRTTNILKSSGGTD